MSDDFSIEKLRKDIEGFDDLCEARDAVVKAMEPHDLTLDVLRKELENYDEQLDELIQKHHPNDQSKMQTVQVFEEKEIECDGCHKVLGFWQWIDEEASSTECPECNKEMGDDEFKVYCSICRSSSN